MKKDRNFIPYTKHEISYADRQKVTEALKDEWITGGNTVSRFENALADFTHAKHAVAVSSGTAALHTALVTAGVQPGDEVIVPALTFVATANAAVFCGAKPVLADIREEDLCIDPYAAQKLINSRTKAIIPVHFAGHPAPMKEISTMADKHKLTVIEDAAHAIGASFNGSPIGNISPFTIFSFHPAKQMTTGEGGAITTNMKALAQAMRRFRNHGMTKEAGQRNKKNGDYRYDVTSLGYNYRITDFQCALGMSQLSRLKQMLAQRRKLANRYLKAFSSLPEITPLEISPEIEHAWHLMTIKLNIKRLKISRDAFLNKLRDAGIGANVHYIPIHYHSYYRNRFGYKPGMFPVTENVFKKILTLPLYSSMTFKEQDYVLDTIEWLLAKNRKQRVI